MKLHLLTLLARVTLTPELPGSLEVTDLTFRLEETKKGSLFFCRKGKRYDSHPDALQAAARGAITLGEHPAPGVMFVTADVSLAARRMFAVLYGDPAAKLSLVGITGTNGKTTTAYLLYRLLQAANRNCGYVGTLGGMYAQKHLPLSHTTPPCEVMQPLLADMLHYGVKTVAMEVSSQALDQNRVEDMRFTLGVFLNLTRDHLDHHGTMEQYFAAKAKLFDRCRTVLFNLDDAYGRRLQSLFADHTRVYTFSSQRDADFTLQIGKSDLSGSVFALTDHSCDITQEFYLPLIGRMSAYDAAVAVIAAKLCCGMQFAQAANYLKTVQAVPGRAERIAIDAPFTVLCDYAHTPDALKRILEECDRIKGEGRVIALFGCGGDRDKGKRPIMARIGEEADLLILTSDNPRSEDPAKILQDMKKGLKNEAKCSIIISRADAIRYALSVARAGDIVALCGKGHEDYQIIGGERLWMDEKQLVTDAWRQLKQNLC